MKCCTCNKEVNLEIETILSTPQWFGKFSGQKLEKVICCECIKDIEKKSKYLEK